MKRSSRNAILCLLLALLLPSSVSCASPVDAGATERVSETLGVWWSEEDEESTEAETLPAPETDYAYPEGTNTSVLDTGKEPAYLILANKAHPLGEHYPDLQHHLFDGA